MATSYKIEVIKSDGTKSIIHNTLATDVKIEPTAFKVTVDNKVLFDGPAFNIETTKTDIPIASSATITSYPTTIEWGKEFHLSGAFVSGTAGIKDISLFIHATANKAYGVAKRDDSTKMWVINNIKFDRAGDKLMRIVTEDNNGNKQEATVTIKATDPTGQPQPIPTPQPQPTTGLAPSIGPVLQASSLDDVFAKMPGMIAGQWIEVADGVYDNKTRRTISKPGIIVKAKTVGGVKLTGAPISISGAGACLYGFDLKTLSEGQTQITISGAGAILKRCFINLDDKNITDSRWIRARAPNVRIENCEIWGKKTKGQMIQADEQAAQGIKIIGNDFHDFVRSPDDAEVIILGLSSLENFEMNGEIAYNRFYKTDGEPEIITIKSSKNFVHHNTFEDTKDAALTNRHGHNNRYEDNVFIRSGFRLFGTGHLVKGNMMIDSPNGQGTSSLVIGGGGTTGSYIAVTNSVFERNIIVQTIAGAVPLILGWQQSGAATNNTFKENIITGTVGTLTGTSGSSVWTGQTMDGNIVFAVPPAKPGNMPALNVDPKLEKQADNTYKYKDWKQGKYLSKSDVGPNA